MSILSAFEKDEVILFHVKTNPAFYHAMQKMRDNPADETSIIVELLKHIQKDADTLRLLAYEHADTHAHEVFK